LIVVPLVLVVAIGLRWNHLRKADLEDH